jgi:hypothetical protein
MRAPHHEAHCRGFAKDLILKVCECFDLGKHGGKTALDARTEFEMEEIES